MTNNFAKSEWRICKLIWRLLNYYLLKLPITFLTSLFALDIKNFPHDGNGNLSYSPQWIFPLLCAYTYTLSRSLIFVGPNGLLGSLPDMILNTDL